jgi:hypothetical protein
MDFQKLKAQIIETEKVISQEIDPSPENKTRAAQEMRKNQAVTSLAKLKDLERSLLRTHSNLYLVVGAQDEVLKTFEKEGCVVADHLLLAKTVANHFWPQFRAGMTLNAYLVQQLNDYMDTICLQIGLDTFIRPKLSMDTKFGDAVQTESELVTLLERMFEVQLKNQVIDAEGHVLQALVASNELMKKYATVDRIAQNVNFVVAVPALSDDVLDAYKNLLSTNIYTAVFKSKSDLTDDKKVTEIVKSVLKKKKETKEV